MSCDRRTKPPRTSLLAAFLIALTTAQTAASAQPRKVELSGIENAYRLSPRLYSGGEPRGEASFAALQALGVKTILSVDGAPPAADLARRYGMRYVHLPIGYDGISRDDAVRIVKAAGTMSGPVFVHCHHGKHRGPTAAALCAMTEQGWSPDQAVSWLKTAGTAPEYRGLFETARSFRPPTSEELRRADADFPERAKVSALIDLMVRADAHSDRLKAVSDPVARASADHPDIDPEHEALQLRELFREAARLDESAARGGEFTAMFSNAELAAETFRAALSKPARQEKHAPNTEIARHFAAVAKTCVVCHARYRDVHP